MCFISYKNSELCLCTDTPNCTYPSGIYPNLTGVDSYKYNGIMTPPVISATQIQGLHTGCMPFESIMESTLECFYRNDCLSNLFDSRRTQPLKTEIKSVYTINTKINDLIYELFIETWSIEKDFELFYSECNPNKCLYSYNRKGNLIFVILTTLSLCSGLIIALRIVSMFIIHLYTIIKKKYSNGSLDNENNQGKSNEINNNNFFFKLIIQICH